MATTFTSDSLDLIVTSDVFEHVRDPDAGFREMFRELRPGGAHIFSIPVTAPMPPETVPRVDISGADDMFLLEPRYHITHLVYNDFGHDLLDRLREIGFRADVVSFDVANPNAARLLTFSTVKPA
jgi:SAM-dependent methyltransferase